MSISPDDHRLYRKSLRPRQARFVAIGRTQILIALAVVALSNAALAQYERKTTISKGPRAVALIQIAANGRAQVLPVTIMVNGDFYDASAYKADPIPMALQPDTVYQGLKSGVPQGLFTITGAAVNHGNWFADGKWETQAQLDAEKAKAAAEEAKKNQTAPEDADIGGPPKLKRAPEPAESSSKPAETPSKPAEVFPPKTTAPASAPAKPSTDQSASAYGPENAPGRPILRRQPVSDTTHEQTKASPESEPLKGPLEILVAVSDAGGPKPRPYTFALKPDEQQDFMKKMLALAADEVQKRVAQLGKEIAAAHPKGQKENVHATPNLENVQMRAFDVSTSNQALVVFTASATMPGDDRQYFVAVVARQDIYGDLQKIFAETTDNRHLDLLPKYDFIDVVDADGDGRAELLFRRTWDSGSAFAVYRALGNRLWPLFEGNPGS